VGVPFWLLLIKSCVGVPRWALSLGLYATVDPWHQVGRDWQGHEVG